MIKLGKSLYADSPTPHHAGASDLERFGPPLVWLSLQALQIAGSGPILYVSLVASVPCASLQTESVSHRFRPQLLPSDKLVSVSAKSSPDRHSRQSDLWKNGLGLMQVIRNVVTRTDKDKEDKEGAPPLSRRSLAGQGGDFDFYSSSNDLPTLRPRKRQSAFLSQQHPPLAAVRIVTLHAQSLHRRHMLS